MSASKLKDILEPYRLLYVNSNDLRRCGVVSVEPFENGYGQTIGNSLRRVMLSSIEGASITCVKINGAEHEYASLPGICDVIDITSNMKLLKFVLPSDEHVVAKISVTGPMDVTAKMIELPRGAACMNPETIICRISEAVKFEALMLIKLGRGYKNNSVNLTHDSKYLGTYGNGSCISINSCFSAVESVAFEVEKIRVGDHQNCEKVTFKIVTDGSVTPEEAMQKAASILMHQYARIANESQQIDTSKFVGHAAEEMRVMSADEQMCDKLMRSLEHLELTVRSQNCLESVGATSVWAIVQMAPSELLKIANFGRKSLNEINDMLGGLGVSLGMEIPQNVMRLMTEKLDAKARGEKR